MKSTKLRKAVAPEGRLTRYRDHGFLFGNGLKDVEGTFGR